MGFFSWNCRGCGYPMLSHYAINADEPFLKWMEEVVCLTKDGEIHTGHYDGYGNVGGFNIVDEAMCRVEVYHKRCWELVGKPTEYRKASEDSADQGFFFSIEEYPQDGPPANVFEMAQIMEKAKKRVGPWEEVREIAKAMKK